ncbi:MAG TPA: DinB family protein [Candidatus Krumholzibacteria bacterium]|nr:DinB family protein [Candidatus Krumholzibacteria bacterium]
MVRYDRPGPDEYAPYYQQYIDLVPAGVTNVINHLKMQGQGTLALMRTLDDRAAEARYAPGKWTVKELVGHLIDTERLFAFRALWIARGETAPQPGMDEVLWGTNSNAGGRRIAELWREQHVCRTDHLYMLKSLDAAAVARRGTANGNPVSVRAIPWIIAGHEQHHLNVLKERYGIG